MISDAFVRVTCDLCGNEEECELPFVYPTLSGNNGRYDHDNPRLPKGWKARAYGTHWCDECETKGGDA